MADINYYQIIYVSEFGQAPEPKLWHNSPVTEEIIPVLTAPGRVFKGWYASSNFQEDTKVLIGDVYDSQDVVYFYGKWDYPQQSFLDVEGLEYLWAHTVSKINESEQRLVSLQVTEEQIMSIFFELGVLEPVTDENGYILTELNNVILTF